MSTRKSGRKYRDRKSYYYIYKIINNICGRFYIGKRISKVAPELDKLYMGSGTLLKRAINKHGVGAFTKEIIEVCENPNELETREIYWIAHLEAQKLGYNITPGGTGGNSMLGRKHSEESKKRMSERAMGRPVSAETVEKILATRKRLGYTKGNCHSQEWKKALSDRFKGENNPAKRQDVRDKISMANKGKKRTAAEIQYNIDVRRARGTIGKSPEVRARISATNKLTKNLYKACNLVTRTIFNVEHL